MGSIQRLLVTAATCLLLAASPPFVGSVTAGCGCDHPPPDWAVVMPPFASAGKTIRIHAQDGSFLPGVRYKVDFGYSIAVHVRAVYEDAIEVEVPSYFLSAGPTTIRVSGRGYDHTYGPEHFTFIPVPRRMPVGDATILISGLDLSVTQDGTLLVPVDLTDVADPTQFAFVLPNLPLTFQPDDVVFFNSDGVDLTLFTLAVDDPTLREWGSYYGWEVEGDTGIVGMVYDTKVMTSLAADRQSDLLTYWRHEFVSYRTAHASGGTHEVNEAGYHGDGTLHIDHDMLVIAIDTHGALPAGRVIADLLVTTVVSENPVEPAVMEERALGSALYVEEDAAADSAEASFWAETDSITLDSTGTLEEASTTTSEATSTETTSKKPGRRSKQ